MAQSVDTQAIMLSEGLTRSPVDWRVEKGLTAYPDAVGFMEHRVDAIADGRLPELVWLVEHPPLYTAGTSAKPGDLLEARHPVHTTGRGGQYTYHGPGQRVAYTMLNLKRRGGDVRRFVRDLEAWLIASLAQFGVTGERRTGRIGIWIERDGKDYKIAALGIRVRHGITYHGVSLNVDPNLSDFDGIVPCGIREHGVTSLADLGIDASMDAVNAAMRVAFEEVFSQR